MGFRYRPKKTNALTRRLLYQDCRSRNTATAAVLNQDVVVQGNPKVYKALKRELAAVLAELQRIEAGNGIDEELLNVIELVFRHSRRRKERNRMNKQK